MGTRVFGRRYRCVAALAPVLCGGCGDGHGFLYVRHCRGTANLECFGDEHTSIFFT